MRYGSSTIAVVLACSLGAQHVVPAGRDAVDGPSIGAFAGASDLMRQQFVIAETHLQPLIGRSLTGLWMRRDFNYPGTLQGSVANLTVRLAVTSFTASTPSASFDSNLGSLPQQVFNGQISVPTSPSPSFGLPDWSPQNTLRIQFDSSFFYSGGTLVVDVTGQPSGAGSEFWPIDMEYVYSDGQIQDYGAGCGRYPFASSVSEGGLEIGATAFFGAWGPPNAFAALAIGTPLIPTLDLSSIGATGCLVYVNPIFGFPTVFSVEVLDTGSGGASVAIKIPSDISLLGASLDAQWVALETSFPSSEWSNPAGLTTSNATRFVLSTAPPTLGLATVTSPVPLAGEPLAPTGYVEINKGPVLRFLYQ